MAQRRWYTIELGRPELYIGSAEHPDPPAVGRPGPGAILSVHPDFRGVESAHIWVGRTPGTIALGLEIGDTAPILGDLAEWETVDTGTMTLPARAVLSGVTLAPPRPPRLDQLASLPTGLHGITVSARGRDGGRADAAVLIQLWPLEHAAPVRTLKHDDTFDPRVHPGGQTVLGRPDDPALLRPPTSDTPAVPVTGQWERLWRIVVNRCDREVWPNLARPGAGTIAVDRAEAGTGVPWPAELREWFTLHDGGGPADLLPGMTLLSLDRMLELHDLQCAIWCELAAEEPDLAVAGENTPASAEAGRFVPEFVPIAERDGTMLVCDTRPGPLRGCVTEFGKDTADMSPPGWHSLGALLADLAHSIERTTPFDRDFLPALTEHGLTWEYSPLG
ncbi:SMI1/KNR4 family protein [Nocardia sp. AG03]|uniref:SMI1/KNR4 family protein n=1 Tax=Nocardia sp. AG03 TaxID=3025312 RepID=UPI00241879B2|nr:SMI1/KNR4 family protein [Nocardia sp. AG03]